jgi:hypothetical protein
MASDDRHRLSARHLRRAAVLLLLGLAQCSELGPYEGPAPSADLHSLCYNRVSATPDQLHTVATQACSGAEPRFVLQQMDLTACPLLIPMRVSFACAG